MHAVDRSGVEALSILLDKIAQCAEQTWGMVCVRRDYLKLMTDEAFQMAVDPLLHKEQSVRLFFAGDKWILIAWQHNQKEVYHLLRATICASLVLSGVEVSPSTVVSYLDPLVRGDDIKAMLNVRGAPKSADAVSSDDEFSFVVDDDGHLSRGVARLAATEQQAILFEEKKRYRPSRKRLQVLVVEDQAFSQRIICEVLRGARSTTYHDGPEVETATGIRDGWKKFVSVAHDIVFVDLGLVDGSGHVLARAIKELDPHSYAIIVTANICEQEINVARQNNVDGFIGKPYNKKQILDCLDKYMANRRGASHGRSR